MAATGATLHPGVSTRAAPSRGTRLPYGWPVYMLFLGYPLWWLLGFGAFIFPVMAVPMSFSLIGRGKVRLPRGFGLYLLFVIWMLASGLQISGPDRMFGFVYRASLYLSAGTLCLYIYNAPKRLLPTRSIVRMMVFFWVIVVAGGLLGLVAPDLEFKTLAESLIPNRLLANEFVYTMVHPTAAQVQTFLGYDVPRPRAPFLYTNDWGGVYALLVPFLIAYWSQIRSLGRKSLLRLLALASLAPVIFSLNRILWLCIGVAIVYGSARFAMRGRTGAVKGMMAMLFVGVFLFNFGPSKQLIDDRLNTNHSGNARATLYKEAADSIGESPLLGYGAPRPSKINPNLPSVGTQGQFWMVLFSHGVPGAIFFTSFLAYSLWRTRRARSQMALWCHVVVLLALVQMPFYGLIPTQIHIILLAIAVAGREAWQPDAPPNGDHPGPNGDEPEIAVAAAPVTNGHALPAAEGHDHNGNGHGAWSRGDA